MKYNTTPLTRIVEQKNSPVIYKKNKGWRPRPSIPVCRLGEEHLVENYDLAKKDNFKGWVCHHRLELTLDGEFANSTIDLINKDMYFYRPYFELIWMRRGMHTSLHSESDKNSMYGRSGNKNPSFKDGRSLRPEYHHEYLREYRKRRRNLQGG